MPPKKKQKLKQKQSNAEPSAASKDSTSNENDSKTQQKRSRRLLRETIDSLHREMDVAEYTKIRGQNRRVTRKDISKQRTQKRKLLEREDYEIAEPEHNIGQQEATSRLRGSQKVLAEDVLEGSLPLAASVAAVAHNREDLEVEEDEHSDEQEHSDEEQEDLDEEEEGEEDGDGEEEGSDDQDADENDQENEQNDSEKQGQNSSATESKMNQEYTVLTTDKTSAATAATATTATTTAPNTKGKGKKRGPYKKKPKSKKASARPRGRRRLFRLKNFQSYKMAQRHGDALGAHARGQPRLAIAQLQQVAKDAPSAPQIYSSLGMVYHDMFQNSWNKVMQVQHQDERNDDDNGNDNSHASMMEQEQIARIQQETGATHENVNRAISQAQGSNEASTSEKTTYSYNNPLLALPDNIPPQYAEPLRLAQKAYGSYHIAAILCKKDYSLWVRAADTACDIAALYSQQILPSNNSTSAASLLPDQKFLRRWYSEAQRDLQTADNLNPPGIDVPTKLAFVQMQLGHMSEALTLWTDLVQRSHTTPQAFQHTAWKVYADCLLKIGYDCHAWQTTQQLPENYMFRRWLKKFADSFDWKERRLQALVLSLEAAAGSSASHALMEWMRQRALVEQQRSSTATTTENDETGQLGKSATAATTTTNDADATKEQPDVSKNKEVPLPTEEFETEKRLLLEKNQEELTAFDQTTENMMEVLDNDTTEESGSNRATAMEERKAERSKMTEAHSVQVTQLEGEYHHAADHSGKADASGTNKNSQAKETTQEQQALAVEDTYMNDRNMPLAASCGEVCAIASELMKHMLSMDIYRGVRLAGEAVSLYMRERAQLHDKRVAARNKLDTTTNMFGMSLFSTKIHSYDEINEDASDDDEDIEDGYISDEDELYHNDVLLNSLRHGVLPPEISVLYALSLIAEGGRNFIAKKCMNSIDHLEQEPVSWLSEEGTVASGLSNNPAWFLFRSCTTEPLGKTTAYALLADVLHRTGKETEVVWLDHFAHMFGRIVGELNNNGMAAEIQNGEPISAVAKYRKNQVLKVILGYGRLQIHSAKANLAKVLAANDVKATEQQIRIVLDCLKSLKQSLGISGPQNLFIESGGSVSGLFIEILDIFSVGLSLILKDCKDVIDRQRLEQAKSESEEIVSWLCGAEPVDGESEESADDIEVLKSNAFPLPSLWQSRQQKAMSLRCYNLCVSFNVAQFSGWEFNEFSLRYANNNRNSLGDSHYFGLQLEGAEVAGFLPPDVEQELSGQWERLPELVSLAKSLDFSRRLAEVKEQQWYKEGIAQHRKMLKLGHIAKDGEAEGLRILLTYSSACLDLARTTKGALERGKLVKTSLSILLPLSQFCLDKKIWMTDIGGLALRDTKEEGWRHVTQKKDSTTDAATPRRLESTRGPSRRRRRSTKPESKLLHEWFPDEDEQAPLTNAVAIPASQLQKLWGPFKQQEQQQPTTPTEEHVIMKQVHDAMMKLRASYTQSNVEKASLEVAVALLSLVDQKCCENPFVVLQQAAIFASQGTKRGNSDAIFRKALPESVSQCKPEDALAILGRADCFLSVQYPYEASFLCNYVAQVCSFHRGGSEQSDDNNESWNNKWMVVGILCYNLTVMIRASAEHLIGQVVKKEDYDPWEEDIVDELLQGRADALQWKPGGESSSSIMDPQILQDRPSSGGTPVTGGMEKGVL